MQLLIATIASSRVSARDAGHLRRGQEGSWREYFTKESYKYKDGSFNKGRVTLYIHLFDAEQTQH
jgi:hypothetical protein